MNNFAGISDVIWENLAAEAIKAQANAYAPYSDFHVGAALLTEDGEIIHGCNVENATYGATVCAERTAVGAAVAKGKRKYKAMAIVTHADQTVAPCGICRQVLAEFADHLPIMLLTNSGLRENVTVDQLLPHRFQKSDFVEE
jgi:cytidine deaminase